MLCLCTSLFASLDSEHLPQEVLMAGALVCTSVNCGEGY